MTRPPDGEAMKGVEEEFEEATTCAAGNSVSFATGTSEEHESLVRTLAGGWRLRRWADGGGRVLERAVDAGRARAWLEQNQHDEALARYFPVPPAE